MNSILLSVLFSFVFSVVTIRSASAASPSQGSVKSFLITEMRNNQGSSHATFAQQVVAKLTSKYPSYSFSAVSYPQLQGWNRHAIQCWSSKCSYVFRRYGRSVVVGWARKNQRVAQYSAAKNAAAQLHLRSCNSRRAIAEIERVLKRKRASMSYIFTCTWKSGCKNPGSYGEGNFYGKWLKCGSTGDWVWMQVMLKKRSWGKK